MEQDNVTSETFAGDTHVESSDGTSEAVVEKEANDALSLAALNQSLGKDFKDLPTALKSIKDTYNYVGKAGQAEKELKKIKEAATGGDQSKLEEQLKEIRKDMFFDKNPEFKEHRKLIEKLGGDPAEVVNSEEFKTIFEKAKGFDETQKLKTVLNSNPRIAQATDKLTQAKKLQDQGQTDEAASMVVKGVLEALQD